MKKEMNTEDNLAIRKVLVTGGAGFIGSNLIRLLLREKPHWDIVNFDALTYAGNLVSLSDIEDHPNYTFIHGDICDREAVTEACQDCWGVLHLAAESHVDRSILESSPFLNTNVLGTHNMLEAALKTKVSRFIQVSTDEVYGSLGKDDPAFTEQNVLCPNSPYSASKASGDLMARSFFTTHDLPVIITRCSNNYGPYQFPEKLIPLLIKNALNNDPIPVYGDGMQIRDWLYVEDHCRGLMKVLENGIPGEVYNFGGNWELPNLNIVRLILKRIGKPESLIEFVKDRPGHDRRYAIDTTKVDRELNWKPERSFEENINLTIDWNQNNPDWIKSVTSGEYLDYYQKQYVDRK